MSIVKPIQGGSPSIEPDSENIPEVNSDENNESTQRRERSKSVTGEIRTSPAILAKRINNARKNKARFSRTQSMVPAGDLRKRKKDERKKKTRRSSGVLGFDKIKSGGELLDTHESIFKGYNVKCMCSVGNQVWVVGHGIIAVYSSKKARLLNELKYKEPNDYVETLQFVQAGQKRNIWSGHKSGKVIIWEVKTKRQISEITKAHKSKVTHVCQVRNRVWTASEDTTIRIWDLRTQKPLDELIDNGYQPARAITYIPETGKVWTAGDDYQIRIRDAKDGSCQSQITGFVQGICQMKKTKGLVWITGTKGSVFIFDAKKMRCIKEIRAYHAPTLALEATTEEVWSLGKDRVMKVFSIKHQRTVKNIFGTNKEIWVTSLKPVGGGQVWAHCSDGYIRAWSTLGNRTDGVIITKRTPKKKRGGGSGKSSLNSSTVSSGKMERTEGKKKQTKEYPEEKNEISSRDVKEASQKLEEVKKKLSPTRKRKRKNYSSNTPSRKTGRKGKKTSSRKKTGYEYRDDDEEDDINLENDESLSSDESDREIVLSPRARQEQIRRGLRRKKRSGKVGSSSATKRTTRPGSKRRKNQSPDDSYNEEIEEEDVMEVSPRQAKSRRKKQPTSGRVKRRNPNRKTDSARKRKSITSPRQKTNTSQSTTSAQKQSPKKKMSSRMLELSGPKTYEVARRLGVGKDDPVTKSSNPRLGRGPASPRTPVIQRGRGKRGRTGGRSGRTGRVKQRGAQGKTPVSSKKSPEVKRAPYIAGKEKNNDFSRDEYREEMGILRKQLTSASDRIVGFRDRLQHRKTKLKENDVMIKDMTKRYQETQEKLMELQEAGLRSSHEVNVHKKTVDQMKDERNEFLEGLSKELGLSRTVRSYGEIMKEIRKSNLKKDTLKRELQYSKQDLLSHIKHLKQIHVNFKKMQKQLLMKEKLISSLNVLLAKTEEKGDQNKIETLLGSFQEMSVHTEKMRGELNEKVKENIRNSGFFDQVYDHLTIIGENLSIVPFEDNAMNQKRRGEMESSSSSGSLQNQHEDGGGGDEGGESNTNIDEDGFGGGSILKEVTQMDRIRYYLQEIQKKTLENVREGGGEKSNASEVIRSMLGELREYMMKDNSDE